MQEVYSDKALHQLASILGRKDVDIEYKSNAATASTNGSIITIPSVCMTDPKALKAVHGFIDHESSHVRWSDFSLAGVFRARGPAWGNLLNILEDARIEMLAIKAYPGMFFNLENTNEYMKDNGLYQKPSRMAQLVNIKASRAAKIISAMESFILYHLGSKILRYKLQEHAEASRKIAVKLTSEKIVSDVARLAEKIKHAKSTQDAADITVEIMEYLKQSCQQPDNQNQSGAGAGDDQSGESSQDNGNQGQSGDGGDQEQSGSDQSSQDDQQQADQDTGNQGQSGDGDDQEQSGADQSSQDDQQQASQDNGNNDSTQDSASQQRQPASNQDSQDNQDQQQAGSDSGSSSGSDDDLDFDFNNIKNEDIKVKSRGEALAELVEKAAKKLLKKGVDDDKHPDVPIYCKPYKADYGQLTPQINQLAKALESQLISILRSAALTREASKRQGSRVNTRSVYRAVTSPNPRIFSHKTIKQDVNANIIVLVDRSGSTGNIKKEMNKNALIITKAFSSTKGIDIHTASFDSRIEVLYNGKGDDFYSFNPISRGSTHTDMAMMHAISALHQMPQKDKNIVFVITDGEPNSIARTKAGYQMLKQLGCEVYGIYVSDYESPSEIAQLARYVDRYTYIPTPQDLPKQMIRMFRDSSKQLNKQVA